jgi:dipeptidyl aminopeptidase/acylaminoacyl peptidase
MSITDAAQDHPEIDASRSAAMGGSFGGYMANWIAGHTDRFDAIVTHASVWNLENSIVIGDIAHEFRRELSPEDAATHSPHQFAGDITSPMLVIHGDKDYRVPIGESLYLWWDLSARSKSADGSSPHKFLYFPDENHWVLAPNHTKIWYATVLAFLAQHLRGETWQRPDLLG